jgi:hypothetical protein
MFGYDLNGFARNFATGAIGATLEATDLIAPHIIKTWQIMTSQKALNFYRQTLTACMTVCAVFVALGMIAREKMDAYVEQCQTEGADQASEMVERAIAKITSTANWTRQQFTFDFFLSVAIRVILALIVLEESLGAVSKRLNFKRLTILHTH